MSPNDFPYQPIPAMTTGDKKDNQAWDESVRHLNDEINQYRALVEPNSPPTGPPPGFVPSYYALPHVGDAKTPPPVEEARQARVFGLAAAMAAVGDSHPDPSVREIWYQRAQEFRRSGANQSKAKRILKDIALGFGIMTAAPLVAVGAALAATGGIFYGLGVFFKGLGGLMTCGAVY